MSKSIDSKIDDLKIQLGKKGIEAPESIQHCGLSALDDNFIDMVHGGGPVQAHGTHSQGTVVVGGSSSSSSSSSSKN